MARDAAELVSVDYEILPAVVDAENAVRPDAPVLHDGAANNTSFTMRMSNEGVVEAAFARAHHITMLSLYNYRLTAVTMEPRGCIADYDSAPAAGRSAAARRMCTAPARSWRIRSCMSRKAAPVSSPAMSAPALA